MKYLCFLVGVLFIVGAFGAWLYFGQTTPPDKQGVFLLPGIVGCFLLGGGYALEANDKTKK